MGLPLELLLNKTNYIHIFSKYSFNLIYVLSSVSRSAHKFYSFNFFRLKYLGISYSYYERCMTRGYLNFGFVSTLLVRTKEFKFATNMLEMLLQFKHNFK